MIIDANIDYFIAIAEGRRVASFNQWWKANATQLAVELPRTQYLHLKFQSFDEICRILDEREIKYTKSFANSNVSASDLIRSVDSIELDPETARLIHEADQLTELELVHEPRRMGFCHLYWSTKKRILKVQFGIDWKTPAEMNPDMCFD